MNKKDLKILFLGTPDISAQFLEKLILNGYKIVGLIAQIDKEKDRKGNLLKVPTKIIAEKYNIPVHQFVKINNNFDEIKNINFDILLTMAYGQIISTDILNLAPYGSYNMHGSLLPKYRGASPIQHSLLNGDEFTGVTLMKMVKEMDAGTIFGSLKIKIEEDDNYSTLQNKIADCAYETFDAFIEDVVNKKNLGYEQDEKEVTFTKKINSDLEKINFNDGDTNVINLIRALSLIPGPYFIYKNEKFKIFKALPFKDNSESLPGTIIKFDKNNFVIKAKSGAIDIKIIQKQGKKVLNYKDFYNGNQNLFKIGDKVNE